MGSLKPWPDEMKHEMRRWDRDREWLARRFMAGWVCMLVSPVLIGFDLAWAAGIVGLLGLCLLWSASA